MQNEENIAQDPKNKLRQLNFSFLIFPSILFWHMASHLSLLCFRSSFMIGFNDCIWKLLPLGNKRRNEQQLNQLKLTTEHQHHHHISKMDRIVLHLMWHCKQKDPDAVKIVMATIISIIKKWHCCKRQNKFNRNISQRLITRTIFSMYQELSIKLDTYRCLLTPY